MSDYFLGEIRLFGTSYAPKGWALCNGQTMQVAQYQALFSLLGIAYGGNGTTTFNLPDLRGRVPIGVGTGGALPAIALGATGGEEFHTLTIAEMPSHPHAVSVNSTTTPQNNTNVPTSGTALGQSAAVGDNSGPINIYNSTLTSATQLAQASISNNGGGQGHENRQPFLAINYCIALNGIYPTRP